FCSQAEDGIRDWSVTGVQPCALPISGNAYVIQSGVKAGEQVVVSGLQKLGDGAPIAEQPDQKPEQKTEKKPEKKKEGSCLSISSDRKRAGEGKGVGRRESGMIIEKRR